MSESMEIELKLLLKSSEDHDALRLLLQPLSPRPKRLTQLNYYLDTVDRLLRRQGVMLRVRVEGGDALVTCKAGATLKDGLMRTGEWQAPLSPAEAARWASRPPSSALSLSTLPVASAVLHALGRTSSSLSSGAPHDKEDLDLQLFIVAPSRNERLVYEVRAAALGLSPPLERDEVLSVELDHTLFPANEERFEVEIEHPRAGELIDSLAMKLLTADIEWRPAEESKYVQLLRLLGEAPELLARGSQFNVP